MRPDAIPVFQAESPDEGAFVSAARNMGFFFCRRSMKDIVVRVDSPEVGPHQRKGLQLIVLARIPL